MNDRRIFLSVASVLSLIFMAHSIQAENCKSLKGIASNDVVGLSGSRDTLWMLTHEESGKFAVNTLAGNGNLGIRAQNDSNWNALYLCNTQSVRDIAFSSGFAVVCTDSVGHLPNDVYVLSKPGGIVLKQPVFGWADAIKNDESIYITAVEVTESQGRFYFACLDGGMVRWDSRSDQMSVIIPGSKPKSFNQLERLDSISQGKPEYRVTSVSTSGDSIIVTTPQKIWVYTQLDSSWDSTVSNKTAISGVTIKSFQWVFSNNRAKRTPLYGFLNLSGGNHSEDSLVLCKYDRKEAIWRVFKDKAPQSIAMGIDGVMYMTEYPNTIKAYIDTLEDSVEIKNPDPLVIHTVIQDSMTARYSIEFPSFINDIFFAPLSDTSGNLWIATSEGLFLSENVHRAQIIRECVLVKRAPVVKGGLAKTYARPGILKTQFWESGAERTVFVYNLSKDTKVTIRIYDYNMDHVKTVISGEMRKAGNNGGPFGRSTVESEDWWDGRNELGKMVAPGIYYYKITTDSGERAFGKMVVAK